MGTGLSLDEIRKLWEKEPDEWVLKAATKDRSEYPPDIQQIIVNEAQKRELLSSVNVYPTSYNCTQTGTGGIKLFKGIFSFIIFAVLILLIDLALYGFYEIHDYIKCGDKKHIVELRQAIQSQEIEIAKLEKELKHMEDELSRISVSSDIQTKYDTCYSLYESKYTEYKSNVNLYNSLVNKQMSRWYLIPIPVPSRTVKGK